MPDRLGYLRFIVNSVLPSDYLGQGYRAWICCGRPWSTAKVFLHTRKELSLTGKDFPFSIRLLSLSLRDITTDKETVRIKLEKIALPFEGYPLDADRIVLNGVVWDWRKNQLRTNMNIASSSLDTLSGISPHEKYAISVHRTIPDGLIFHDIERGTSIHMYEGLKVRSPRFSPDGGKWAFFTRDQLIIRWTSEDREKRVPLPTTKRHVYAHHLAWSPSGRYIAGLVSENGLVIWDSDGNHLKTVSTPRGTMFSSWPPMWIYDEKSVYVVSGNESLVGKFEPLKLTLVPIW